MRFDRIELSQMEQIEKTRGDSGHILLSHSFCTLFLWKETLGLSILLDDDFFVVRCSQKGENAYFFPCGREEKCESFIASHIDEPGFCMHYLRQSDKSFISEHFGDRLVSSFDPDGSEYLFSVQEQLALSGGRFKKMRQEKRRLSDKYTVESVPLCADNMSAAAEVVEAWESSHIPNDKVSFDDILVAKNSLKYFDELSLFGTLGLLDGKPASLVIGGEITPDTFGVQIAKMKKPENGLMYHALHGCYGQLDSKYKLINGDDDMGIDGLRLLKHKLQPCSQNEVWRAEKK